MVAFFSSTRPAFTSIALWYNQHTTNQHSPYQSMPPAHESILPAMLGLLPNGFHSQTILDICCGTGLFTRRLVEAGATSVMGLDICDRFIIYARQEEKRFTSSGREVIRYIVDDATRLITQETASTDLVTCCLGLTVVADLPALYRAVARVLKPGGHALFSIIHPAAPCSTADDHLKHIPIPYHHLGIYKTHNTKSVRGRILTYHRPLSYYLAQAKMADLHLKDLVETPASAELVARIPEYQYVPYGLVFTCNRRERNENL